MGIAEMDTSQERCISREELMAYTDSGTSENSEALMRLFDKITECRGGSQTATPRLLDPVPFQPTCCFSMR